jgi:GxxExxY protein
MKVHSKLGRGFPNAFIKERWLLSLKKLKCLTNENRNGKCYYEGQLIGKRRVDFVIMDRVLVDLKAISNFDPSDYNQILNYLEAFNMEIGLLINFGKRAWSLKDLPIMIGNRLLKIKVLKSNSINHKHAK